MTHPPSGPLAANEALRFINWKRWSFWPSDTGTQTCSLDFLWGLGDTHVIFPVIQTEWHCKTSVPSKIHVCLARVIATWSCRTFSLKWGFFTKSSTLGQWLTLSLCPCVHHFRNANIPIREAVWLASMMYYHSSPAALISAPARGQFQTLHCIIILSPPPPPKKGGALVVFFAVLAVKLLRTTARCRNNPAKMQLK